MNANMKGPQGNTLTRRLCKGRENQECVGNRELNGRVFFLNLFVYFLTDHGK